MNIVCKIFFVLIVFNFVTLSCVSWFPEKQANVNKNIFVIETDYGNMRIKLFDATPKHRDNFKKLVADSFYNGTIFHRVIHGFMIQGGTSNMKNENSNHTIEAEFVDSLIHKKGALAAARQPDYLNPKKNSSGFEFYIVQGVAIQEESLALSEQNINAMRKRSLAKVVFEDSLNAELKTKFLRARSNSQQDSTAYYGNKLEEKLTDAMLGKEFKYSEKQIALYDSLGGTPHLDGAYTVFGEVISGMNIIDSIASTKTDDGNRPLKDIKMIIKKL